jgi:hypothetical protein
MLHKGLGQRDTYIQTQSDTERERERGWKIHARRVQKDDAPGFIKV